MEVPLQIYHHVNDRVVHRFTKPISTFDAQISRNLKNSGFQTRPAKSNGLWCCALLPAILITYTIQQKVSILYHIVAYASVGLLCYCLLFIIFISISCLVLKEVIYGGCIASSLIVTLLLFTFSGQDLTFSLMCSLPQLYLFSTLLRMSITMCPKTFTIGEAMIVVQAIVLFTGMVAAKLVFKLDNQVDEELEFVSKIVFTILSTVGLIVTALYLLGDQYRNMKALGSTIGIGAVYALIVLHAILGNTCIFKIFQYIFMNKDRAQLFTFWLAMAVISAFVLLVRTKLAVKATTVTRKTFHVFASLVFMSGIVTDVYLMTFAAGFGLGVLILLEAIRKLKIEPISRPLESAFLVYSDEKDVGTFAMTPMYLYLGLACPLLLVPAHAGWRLELLSGVLATGVGDTAASWFGSRYGFNKWPGGQKTLEGTLFNIISQVATVHVLQLFDLLHVKNALMRATIAAILTGIAEAKTDQVDNLILPLINLLAFQATWYLC